MLPHIAQSRPGCCLESAVAALHVRRCKPRFLDCVLRLSWRPDTAFPYTRTSRSRSHRPSVHKSAYSDVDRKAGEPIHAMRFFSLALLAIAGLHSSAALAFALAAPTGQFGLAGFADFGKGFSWAKEFEIAFDQSYTDAFGDNGKTVFTSALSTWATSSSNPKPNDAALQLERSRNDLRDKFDLETVALHELGHAIGLHHPTQAAGRDFTKGKNFDAKGNKKDPVEIRKATPIMDLTPETTLGLEGRARRQLTTDDIDGFSSLYQADLKFKVGAKQAQTGTDKGGDIDVFAFDFGTMNFLKPFDGALAITDTAVDKAPERGPGTIKGVDIFFHIKPKAKVPEPPTLLLLTSAWLAILLARGGFLGGRFRMK